MIEEESLSRGVINNRISRIKRFFKWDISEQLAPSGTYEAIRTVSGLRYGKTTARETDPVRPVPDAFVDLVLPVLSPPIRALVELQRTTGMRPCEVVIMRASDIDMSGEVWLYEPAEHKNQWRGHRRVIPLGPKAQKNRHAFSQAQNSSVSFQPAGCRGMAKRTPTLKSKNTDDSFAG
jgi:site-specific recombinase XerD